MKKLSFLAVLIFAGWCTFTATSCNNARNSHNNSDSTAIMSDSLQTNSLTSDDTSFMKDAAMGGMMEIKLGKLAASQAGNQRVKDFGLMMVRDHNQINDNLKTLAAQYNVMLPDSCTHDQQEHYTDLVKEKGKKFDKDYMKLMVDAHTKDLSAFQNMANNTNNLQLKTFAGNSAQIIATHLDSAQAIDKDIR